MMKYQRLFAMHNYHTLLTGNYANAQAYFFRWEKQRYFAQFSVCSAVSCPWSDSATRLKVENIFGLLILKANSTIAQSWNWTQIQLCIYIYTYTYINCVWLSWEMPNWNEYMKCQKCANWKNSDTQQSANIAKRESYHISNKLIEHCKNIIYI